jgi:hypothetical protein
MLPLAMTLGYINQAAREAVYLAPEAGKTEPLTEFNCVIGMPKPWTAKGAVIGRITPTNTKTDEFTLSFAQSKGVQEVSVLEGSKKAHSNSSPTEKHSKKPVRQQRIRSSRER